MKTELEKARARLARVEKELDKNRTSVIDDGWQTSKYSKKARKWDVLAQEKMKLKADIEEMEEQAQREIYYCGSCFALNEMECVCLDGLEY